MRAEFCIVLFRCLLFPEQVLCQIQTSVSNGSVIWGRHNLHGKFLYFTLHFSLFLTFFIFPPLRFLPLSYFLCFTSSSVLLPTLSFIIILLLYSLSLFSLRYSFLPFLFLPFHFPLFSFPYFLPPSCLLYFIPFSPFFLLLFLSLFIHFLLFPFLYFSYFLPFSLRPFFILVSFLSYLCL
jgi:hypothetical protein